MNKLSGRLFLLPTRRTLDPETPPFHPITPFFISYLGSYIFPYLRKEGGTDMSKRRNRRPEPRCFNLVQNPSFEAGFASWETSGDIFIQTGAYEGVHVVQMGEGEASLWQDVSLSGVATLPLLLSFNLFGSFLEISPNTTVEVLWLDAHRNSIGQGRRLFIGEGTLGGVLSARHTFLAITETPPRDATYARVLFSKPEGLNNSLLQIDQVILTPVRTLNLVQNHGFEADLLSWSTGGTFSTNYELHMVGAASAISAESGLLSQDIPITNQPKRSPYLLSFALQCEDEVTVRVTVQWLDSSDSVIGTGLELTVPMDTLRAQHGFLTYLALTEPAPRGATTARITFETSASETGLRVDQVIFARTRTTNLVQNPSFEDELNGWSADQLTALNSSVAYEGNWMAHFDNEGGALWQDVPLTSAAGNCFIFSCALRAGFTDVGTAVTNGLIKLIWLDRRGREIGLGLSLVVRPIALTQVGPVWLLYVAITDKAPVGTAAVRISITKPSETNGSLDVDRVLLGRL